MTDCAHLAYTLPDGQVVDIRASGLGHAVAYPGDGVSVYRANVWIGQGTHSIAIFSDLFLAKRPKQPFRIWDGLDKPDSGGLGSFGGADRQGVLAAIESCVHDLYDMQPERRAQAEAQHGGMPALG